MISSELGMPCLKAANDPINATDFRSIGTVPFDMEDTSHNTTEHTLAPMFVSNPKNTLDQENPGSILENYVSELENSDSDDES